MLYLLFRWLNEELGFPRLGVYVTFRAAAAFFTALCCCLLAGPAFLRAMRRLQIADRHEKLGKERRALIPEGKAGTPAMGGLLTGSSVFVAALAWCRPDEALVWIGLFVFVACGLVGLWDDRVKLFHPTLHGIPGRVKFWTVAAIGGCAALALALVVWRETPERLVLVLPFFKEANVGLTWLFGLPFLVLVVLTLCGSAQAVNLSDGMDGLAAGCLAIAGTALVGICYVVGRVDFAEWFFLVHVPGAGEVAVLCAALVGAALGFLWYNAAPAQCIMGDVGSLSMGGLLGFAAVAARMEVSLLIVGGVFVIEALSVMIQVGSMRLRGKRVFLCTPIHHHFQQLGIPETKIVARFWIVAICCAVLSLAFLKVR